MRLTLVTETFPPEVNGVARTLGRWVAAFQERGHAVTVIRPRQPGERLSRFMVRGWGLPFYPEVRIGIATPGQVGRFLHGSMPDLVHVATEGPLGLAALLAANRPISVASSFHTNYDHYLAHYGFGLLEWAGARYLRWFHNCTALTLVPSEGTRQRLASEGYQRLAIWPRGVDAEAFNPRHRDPHLRASLGLAANDPLILYVGRLAPEKNVQALLDAFATIQPRPGNRTRLALVGGGPMLDSLLREKRTGVILAGYQHGPALARWYASADLFVFPSLTDTFGNVMLEAQASGLPVVGFDVAPVNERVRNERDGLLVPTTESLAPALQRLLGDHAWREELGKTARLAAERQGWKPIFDLLERRYLALVAGQDPVMI